MIDCPHSRQHLTSNGWECSLCGLAMPSQRMRIEDLASVQVAPSAMPSRLNGIAPRTPNNSFEKGIRRDERGVPYLDSQGSPLRMKEPFRKADYRESITIHTGSH